MEGMQRPGRAWIALNLEHLRHNVAALQARLPLGRQLMPVVKANAYGHGAVPIARELNSLGIRAFCVATAEEGRSSVKTALPGTFWFWALLLWRRWPWPGAMT